MPFVFFTLIVHAGNLKRRLANCRNNHYWGGGGVVICQPKISRCHPPTCLKCWKAHHQSGTPAFSPAVLESTDLLARVVDVSVARKCK